MNEQKLARICWNTNNWQKPSGKEGKSRNATANEAIVGYGHEEWLFDFEKIIDGYHYAFIEEIGKDRRKYEGKKIDIFFFTINYDTKQWWWIGEVKNVEVISQNESLKIFKEFKRRGWFDEMINETKYVDADPKYLGQHPKYFVKIRFKVRDVHLDRPFQIRNNDPAVPSHRYVLMDFVRLPRLPVSNKFLFKSGHSKKEEGAIVNYDAHKKKIDLRHNRMQEKVYKQLTAIYGRKNVGTELFVNGNSKIDIVVKRGKSFTFYEIKTSNSLLQCVREAFSQLLEYAYFPNTSKATNLIIVSHNKMSSDIEKYLKHLRNKFRLPIYYQQYDLEKNALDSKLY